MKIHNSDPIHWVSRNKMTFYKSPTYFVNNIELVKSYECIHFKLRRTFDPTLSLWCRSTVTVVLLTARLVSEKSVSPLTTIKFKYIYHCVVANVRVDSKVSIEVTLFPRITCTEHISERPNWFTALLTTVPIGNFCAGVVSSNASSITRLRNKS